jgi:hypothetical protein
MVVSNVYHTIVWWVATNPFNDLIYRGVGFLEILGQNLVEVS